MAVVRRWGAFVVCAALVSGCDRDESRRGSTTSAAASVRATPSATSASPSATLDPKGLTGVLSEEDFKKLHELRVDSPPPRRGATLELSSSRAYLSLPPNSKPPLPAVVLIHEWWGLNAHIKHWADRLAADGYAAIAVDLYGGKTAKTPDEAMEMMKAVDEHQATEILLEAFRFLAEDKRVSATRRASIGWCFGGKWSLNLALSAPQLDAAVVYYGHVTTDAEKLAALEAPLLGIFGKKDKSIPLKVVDRFEMGLEQAGDKKYKLLRYDAEHAFANPSSGRYDQKAATAAWSEVRSFLAKHVKVAPKTP